MKINKNLPNLAFRLSITVHRIITPTAWGATTILHYVILLNSIFRNGAGRAVELLFDHVRHENQRPPKMSRRRDHTERA